MINTLLMLGILTSPNIYGGNALYPDREDFVGGSGVASGLFGMQICTQDQDDTTPGVGLGYGPLGLGCNIVILADNNTGPITITTFDGIPPAVPGTPGSILYVVAPATAANPSTIPDSGNFELERAFVAPATGQETRTITLECLAANDFEERGRHNGPRYFDDIIMQVAALIAASGNEVAFDLSYTVNKAAGNDTGLKIYQTDTASPGTSKILDLGVGANSQWYVTNAGIMTLYGNAWTDYQQWYGDGTDAYYRWSDGDLIIQTDEAANSASHLLVKPKGSSEVTSVDLYDTDTRELYAYTAANRSYIESGSGELGLQNAVVQDVLLWEGIASGNPSLILYGWNTAGSDRESTELTMDDANDEFLIQAPNSANHEGISISLQEANQLFRVRGSDGNVDFSSSDTALLAVNPATFNDTLDAESYMVIGNGSALSALDTLIIDRDFSTATTGHQQVITGLITVTGGTSDVSTMLIAPQGVTLNDGGPGTHGNIASLEIQEPVVTETVGAVTDTALLWLSGSVASEGTNNYSIHDETGGLAYFTGSLTVDGTLTAGSLTMAGDIDMNDNSIKNPLDGIYGEAPTADTDPDDILIHSEHSYSQGSQTESNLVLGGGLAEKYFTATDWANSTDDTLRISIGKCTAGVCGVANTTLTESVDWDCDLTSNAACACALYDYIEANPISGVTPGRTDGTCSDAKVFLQPNDANTYFVNLSTDDAGGGGVWGTGTAGIDGYVTSVQYAVGEITHGTVDVNGTTKSFDFSAHGNDVADRYVSYMDRCSDTHSPTLMIARTRGTHVAPTVVADDDILGMIEISGWDGTDLARGAQIKALVDGTPGADDMPTEIVLATSPAGAQVPVDRMAVKPDGTVDILDVLALNAVTISDGDATPDVGGGNIFVTSANTGATAITDLDNPTIGQMVTICGGSNTNSSTIADAGNFSLLEAMTLALDECITMVVQADNDYVEVARNNMALTPWTSDVDAAGYDLKNLDDLYGDAVATDAAPRITVLGTQPIHTAPGATNVTGADLVLAPSPGENTLEGVTRAATTGDTLTFTVCINGTCSDTVKTEGAGAGAGWDCDGAASDAECVCNLYAELTGGGSISGVTVARTDGTCSDEKLTFNITPGTSEYIYVATSDDTNMDMTNGTDGSVIVGAGASVGLRNGAGWWDLQADGDLILDNPGATVNSPSLSLRGDDGGVEEEASIHLVQGADPYLRISVDDDNTTPALTGVLDIHDTALAFVTDNTVDIGAVAANRPKDLHLAGNAAVAGSITSTSFIIGGNTLTTTEWGNLDGQNQTVSTTSSPTFDDITMGDTFQMTPVTCDTGNPNGVAPGTSGRIMYVSDGAELLCCDTGAAWVGCAGGTTCCP